MKERKGNGRKLHGIQRSRFIWQKKKRKGRKRRDVNETTNRNEAARVMVFLE